MTTKEEIHEAKIEVLVPVPKALFFDMDSIKKEAALEVLVPIPKALFFDNSEQSGVSHVRSLSACSEGIVL